VKVETQIRLDKFVLRGYQIPLFKAIVEGKYKRILSIWPRRAGKDVVSFNALLHCALHRKGTYWYVFPTFSQARKVIWQSITNEGKRFLDYIPRELIKKTNDSEMRIELINESCIQLIGSDHIDALVGSNIHGIIYSEYALQNELAYQLLRPILLKSEGFAVFISTPRGKNHLFTLYEIARSNPKDWFCQLLTVSDTGHITLQEIEKERQSGLMSEDLIEQEYFCSFSAGVEGAFYARYLDRMRVNGQIGCVPWESGFKVHTAWDIGVRDNTSIIFFQTIGQTVRIIDYYEKSKEGLEYYIKILHEKPYIYGKHIAPADIAVKEFGTGMTRLEKARHLGITFTTAPSLGSIMDGIETTRTTLSKIWIDETKCKQLIACLESYRQEYDNKKKIYNSQPLHDWSSHGADAMRYLCISLPKTRDGLSAEELDRRFLEATAGPQAQLPKFFRDDEPKY
jgi:hypothetical protein